MNLSAVNGLATITRSTWDLARNIRNDGTTTTVLFWDWTPEDITSGTLRSTQEIVLPISGSVTRLVRRILCQLVAKAGHHVASAT